METVSFTFIDILINIVLAAIMLGLGLSLTTDNFKNIIRYPRAFFIGLSSQMIALPLLAFVLLLFTNLTPEFKVGIMILASCPGGTTSGFVTFLFKGNLALAIALTSVNSLLTIFTIPLITNLSLEYFMHQHAELNLPLWNTVLQIFLITLLPAGLGILIKSNFSRFAEAIQSKIKYILILLLAVVYSIKFFAGEEHGGTGIVWKEVWVLMPYVLIFNIVCFVFSIGIGKLTSLKIRDAYTIAIEVSLHNTTLALLIGGTLLQNQELVKPALIYSMFSFWTAIIFVQFIKWIYKKKIQTEKI